MAPRNRMSSRRGLLVEMETDEDTRMEVEDSEKSGEEGGGERRRMVVVTEEETSERIRRSPSHNHTAAKSPESSRFFSPSTSRAARTTPDYSTPTSNGAKKSKTGEDDDDAGTKKEQDEFMQDLETFHKERSLEFKPPKFYGEPLNCLKLWRAVIRLGGYDRVTASKLWRQVGESFHPPKTCTTVSWTFRIFYEKALLEYEKYKRQIGELEFTGAPLLEPISVDFEGSVFQNSGSGRARRDAAARAMQGWHAQRLVGFGEVGEPIIKDKNLGSSQRREKHLKSIGVINRRKPTNLEAPDNNWRMEGNRHQQTKRLINLGQTIKELGWNGLVRKMLIELNLTHLKAPPKRFSPSVVDVGPPADWVKINVREIKDGFEVYALVPGLLREEVRVQSDPAGRLVITGQPEQIDNPWGITPFRKVVNLPARINPLQTSAVVSLHGRLFVHVPIER